MSYDITVGPATPGVTLRNVESGQLAIVIEGEFAGELFYKNVAGIIGISRDRWWPSQYVADKMHDRGNNYRGPLDSVCRVIKPGDVLHID